MSNASFSIDKVIVIEHLSIVMSTPKLRCKNGEYKQQVRSVHEEWSWHVVSLSKLPRGTLRGQSAKEMLDKIKHNLHEHLHCLCVCVYACQTVNIGNNFLKNHQFKTLIRRR